MSFLRMWIFVSYLSEAEANPCLTIEELSLLTNVGRSSKNICCLVFGKVVWVRRNVSEENKANRITTWNLLH